MTTYRVGQTVRYAAPETDERDLRFVIVENNGDRILIESLDFPHWRVKPRETVAATDIVSAEPPR